MIYSLLGISPFPRFGGSHVFSRCLKKGGRVGAQISGGPGFSGAIYPTKSRHFWVDGFPNFPGWGLWWKVIFVWVGKNYNHFGGFLVLLDHIQQLSNAGYYMVGSFLEIVSKGFWKAFAFQEDCMVCGFVVSWIHYILHCTGQNLKIDLNASQNKLSGRASEFLVRPVLWSSKWLPLPQSNMSNEKKGPLGVYGYMSMSGMILPSYVGNIS